MSGTIRISYRGWNITATCLKHADSDPRAARRFTARAFAALNDIADGNQWHDSQTQTASIVDHIFVSANACTETLLGQIKTVIDNLSRTCKPLSEAKA